MLHRVSLKQGFRVKMLHRVSLKHVFRWPELGMKMEELQDGLEFFDRVNSR
jgi:hypothetical protein